MPQPLNQYDNPRYRRRFRAAFSLVELLIVITIMGIMAGLLLPRFEPSIHEQLQGTAQILAADLSYARNLAVANDSRYRVTLRVSDNSYTLVHAGTNTLLDVLPQTPYRNATDAPNEQSTFLEDLPHIGAHVEIAGVQIGGNSPGPSGSVEFDSLGGLTITQPITIWLACGNDDARRYLPLTVMPVTGLCEVGEFTGIAP
jgi:prepilin-type N-terminal cleavage/methylation domain-containing protein